MAEQCENCKVSGVKLWRDTIRNGGSFHLQCLRCIRKERGDVQPEIRIAPVPDSFQMTKVAAILSDVNPDVYYPIDLTEPHLVEQWRMLPETAGLSNMWYNEIDPYCVEWLKNLSSKGHINRGTVDNRSIRELTAKDVPDGQAHFFAGLGAWSLALRISGIADDAPIWTGSCPCQPFSQSGSRRGFSDDRHLWPDWFRLIAEHQPVLLFGEQVASKDGLQWLDLVFSDLEGAGYTCAAADLCAAGVGAPHRRQRLYFCAYRPGARWDTSWWSGAHRGAGQGVDNAAGLGSGIERDEAGRSRQPLLELDGPSQLGATGQDLANPSGKRRRKGGPSKTGARREAGEPGGLRLAIDLANPPGQRRISWGGPSETSPGGDSARIESRRFCDAGELALSNEPDAGPERQQPGRELGQSPQDYRVDPWSEIDWIVCSDQKIRPTQPSLFPLAHGTPGRLGRLRAYGNAIVPQVAATFVQATLEAIFFP